MHSRLTKFCPKCSLDKPVEYFPRNDAYAGGYGSWCKACHKVYTANLYRIHGPNRAGARTFHPRAPTAVKPPTTVTDALRDAGLTLHEDVVREIGALVRCGVDVRTAIASFVEERRKRLARSKIPVASEEEKWRRWRDRTAET